jgi:hypothetical protein
MVRWQPMFAGHLGAGLALKGCSNSVSLGALLFAALALDVVLWLLVLGGVEAFRAPADYRTTADLTYDFPYSHSLVASLAWSLLGGTVAWLLRRSNGPERTQAALVIAAAMFSHFILDWLVHIPELPVMGNGSFKIGLGLWRHLSVAWCVEGLVAAAGLWLYLHTTKLTTTRKVTLLLMMALVMALTILGQARHASPPTPCQMAVSSLITIVVLIAVGFWIDHRTTVQRREES